MENFGNEFGELLHEQKKLIKHYEEVVSAYQKSEINTQNIKLKKELEELKESLEALKSSYLDSEKKVKQLKAYLIEQMVSEKTQLLTSSKQKLQTYFGRAGGEVMDRLSQMEQSQAIEIQRIKSEYTKKLGSDYKVFQEKLEGIKYDMQQKVLERTGELKIRQKQLEESRNKRLSEFQEADITTEMLQKRIKQNNIEVKIGLNWLSKAGVLLILIGVITAMRYSYSFFTASTKGVFGMLIGLVFLGMGEFFSQKKKLVLGNALTGGGIGISYLTIFWSYFVLGIIDLRGALVLSVLLSVTAFVLSIRYNSKTIGAFALIGGYLPLLSYISMGELKGEAIYIGMGYVFILNLVTILIAIKKDWIILKLLSFISHLPILLYLTYNSGSGQVAITYALLAFSMYLTMILAYPLWFKQKLRAGHIVFLGANTFLSCVVSYGLFNHFGFDDYRGLLALAFGGVYLTLNLIVGKWTKGEKEVGVIFGITALTFAVLVIPFQFGRDWVVLGWFIEGVLLILYRSKIKSKLAEIGGIAIFALCLLSFVVLFGEYQAQNINDLSLLKGFNMADINYSIITIGTLGVMVSYLKEVRKSFGELLGFYDRGKLVTGYKYFALLNVWIYLNYAANRIYSLLGENARVIGDGDRVLLFVIITAVLAYTISKVRLLQDAGIRYVTIAMTIIVNALCVMMNLMPGFIDDTSKGIGITVLIIYNILVLLSIREILKGLIKKENMNGEIYPVIMSAYILFNTTALLKMQLNIGYVDFIISIFYIIAAFVLIIVGFKYHYRYIRYGGLVLSILATAKLFLFDASSLWEQYRIISYFCFGIVLIAISYVYQQFSKNIVLESKDLKIDDW